MSTAASAVPTTIAPFTDPGFVADPYPVYEEIRAIGRVVVHEPTGQYLTAAWRDSARVLGNAASFGSDVARTIDRFGAETIECMDKDRHDAVKSIWSDDFKRGTLEAHRELIREVVDSRLLPFAERLRAGEHVDAVA